MHQRSTALTKYLVVKQLCAQPASWEHALIARGVLDLSPAHAIVVLQDIADLSRRQGNHALPSNARCWFVSCFDRPQ